MNFKLSPCARLLLDWFRLKSPPGVVFKARLQDFQALMAEQDLRRGKPYSMRQIRNAVSQLQELELIDIKHDEMHLSTREVGKLKPQSTSKKSASGAGKSTSKPRNYFPNQEINFQAEKLISNQEAETVATSSFSSSIDLIDLTDLSISKREGGQKENFNEEISSQENEFKAGEEEVKSRELTRLEDQPSAAEIAPKVYRDRTAECYNRPPGKLDWEIEPGVAYPAFVEWRAQHYRKQGGHLADAAVANAKSEFRKNPARTADLWQEFLSYSNQAADNALVAQQAGIKAEMPSCFSEAAPVTKGEVLRKLEAVNASTALPAAPETATAPKAKVITPSVVKLQDGRVLPVVSAADFEVEPSKMPDFIREQLERLSAKRTMPRQSTEAAKRAEIDVQAIERQLKGQDSLEDDAWF